MRSVEETYTDLEADRSSREAEIRLVERLAANSARTEQSMLRRALIILTYAHLEGFTKFALFAYAGAINAESVKCETAAYPIAAASLNRVFAALRNPQSKHEVFKKSLPDDTQLHMLAREQSFIKSYEEVIGQKVDIPDAVIDTKSNLSPDIMKKLLFQLGLGYTKIDGHQGAMNKLLGIRNAIAHGDRLLVPSQADVDDYVKTTLAVMTFLQSEVFSALSSKTYLRATAS